VIVFRLAGAVLLSSVILVAATLRVERTQVSLSVDASGCLFLGSKPAVSVSPSDGALEIKA
jgi:hypothetical protein